MVAQANVGTANTFFSQLQAIAANRPSINNTQNSTSTVYNTRHD
jgi:hypothetical protein